MSKFMGYAGSANKALEIGHQVRQAQLTMLSPQQQLDAIAVSVSAAEKIHPFRRL